MLDNIYVLDNFFDKPEDVRKELSNMKYSNSQILPGRKPAYPGTNSIENLPENIEKYMMAKLKEKINAKEVWRGDMPSVARVAFNNETSDITVHTDRAYNLDFKSGQVLNNPYIQWTVLVYLTKEEYCQGGLSFQKNENLNTNCFPLNHDAETDISHVYDIYQSVLYNDYVNPSSYSWTTIKKLDMKYNRGIIFPAHYFHSIFGPQGFGDSFDNCRLISAGWFYTK